MLAVKKLKPIEFNTDRDVIISALAIYYGEYLNPIGDNNRPISKLLELKSKFYQKFKVDYDDVVAKLMPILIHIEKPRTKSPKDVSVLYEIYERYIEIIRLSDSRPVKIGVTNETISLISSIHGNSSEWLYKGFVYGVQGHHSEDEIRLLILGDFDKERRRFEKLRAKFDDTSSEDLNYERPRIPEKVRIEVWRRDGGKCARCGSREKLEYDHIVPISKGGSNTARNIELLCEKCNRSKSNNVV